MNSFCSDHKTTSSQSDLEISQAIARAAKIKEEIRNRLKQKNREKKDKFNMNKLMILKNEHRRKIEMDKQLGIKLEKASQLKKHLQDEKILNRFTAGVEFFKKHWLFRDEIRAKNIHIYRLHEEEKRRNMEVVPFHILSLFFLPFLFPNN